MKGKLALLSRPLIASPRFGLVVALGVFLLLVLLGELFVSIDQREAKTRLTSETLAHASELRGRIERELNSLLYLNSGLSSYLVVRRDNIQEAEVSDILAVLHRSSRHVRNFGIAIGDQLIYVYPKAGNEAAIGLRYREQPQQWPVVQMAIATGKPVLAGPIDLVQGGRGLVYRIPLMVDDTYWGLLSSVIDPDSLLHAIFAQADTAPFFYALRSDDLGHLEGLEGQLIQGDPALFQDAQSVIQKIEVPGGCWTIAVKARPAEPRLRMSIALRVASISLGGLIAWLIFVLLRNRAELATLVMFDTLTGLPNRRLLQNRHEMALARLQRNPQHQCVLLFIDLDGFKKINDTFGHKTGDAVLQEIAQRLRRSMRPNDTVARWGGDEFVILLEDVSNPVVDRMTQRLRERIKEPIKFMGLRLHLDVSIGSAVYPPEGVSLEEIMKQADQRMYQEKSLHKALLAD